MSNSEPEFSKLDSNIGVIRLGSADEKIVILTEARLKALEKIIEDLKNTNLSGLIITGSSLKMFSAGADINVIGSTQTIAEGTELATKGQSVFNLIEDLNIPTVAAIGGPAVGGACELALACNYRIINEKNSSIGLPEVKIGILPGFGGSVRLPKLIGLPEALKIILTGKVLKSWQACKIGLVDKIVQSESLEELIKSSEDFLLNNPKNNSKISFSDILKTKINFLRKKVYSYSYQQLIKKTAGHYPAPLKALEVTVSGIGKDRASALKAEAQALGELIASPECKALTNLFFLTEYSKGIGKSAKEHVANLKTLVIGAGIMGSGIAGELARNGYSVRIKEAKKEAIDKGLDQISKNLSYRKSLTEDDRNKILSSIHGITDYGEKLSQINFVIEAIYENAELKSQVLSEAAQHIDPNSIIASNTSSLSLTDIASNIDKPERVVGMHFFNPVPLMPLVEIVRGKETSDETISKIAALTTKLGKFPIVVEDVPGFLVNRILSSYLIESAFLISEGYKIEDIDQAAKNFGLPMGPIRLLDEIGLDVATHVMKTMINGYGKRMSGPDHLEKMVLANRLGKKNEIGFYNFATEKEIVDPGVYSLLGVENKSDNNPVLIQDRLIFSLIKEACLCLDEGVAGKPGKEAANQVDLGSIMGMGFPAFRGGIIYYAESLGATKVINKLQELEREVGERFRPTKDIFTRAEKGLSFYDPLP